MSDGAGVVCEVIVTGPVGERMRELSREVVSARLAASANVWSAPVLSTYWGRGKLEVGRVSTSSPTRPMA